MNYSEKLRDPRWQKRRLEILERDGWKCVATGKSDETLNVHHRLYYKNPWDAPDGALETICETVHELIEPHAKGIRAMYPNSCVSASDIFKAQHDAVCSIADKEYSGDIEKCLNKVPFWKIDMLVCWKIANIYGLYKPKIKTKVSTAKEFQHA